jgi:hypothetical protein
VHPVYIKDQFRGAVEYFGIPLEVRCCVDNLEKADTRPISTLRRRSGNTSSVWS